MTAKALIDYASSGTYTATVTGATNITGGNAGVTNTSNLFYIRVGNIVSVWGAVDVNITAGSTQTAFNLSLPIASDLATFRDLSGSGNWYGVGGGNTNGNAICWGDAAANTAYFDWKSQGSGNQSMTIQFSYILK